MRLFFLSVSIVLLSSATLINAKEPKKSSPNIVIIYGDDIGYGDFGCYGAKTIPTPNIDRLAEGGLRFVSAYCTSATCTPSRYSMLAGEYAWRRRGTGVAPPNGIALIKPGRTTLPSILQRAGYTTAIIGKWHLGLGEHPKPDWSGTIKPGPLEIGFDYCFLMPTTNDRVPCVYVENHHIVNAIADDPVNVFYQNPDGQPTGKTHRDTLKMDWSHGHNQSIVNGIGRIGFMVGGQAARWVDEDMSDLFIKKSEKFIRDNSDRPFFLLFSSQSIHVPRVPHARFVGATPHGPRGDAVVEFDDGVGKIIQALEKAGVLRNTLVIVTSDNGPVLDDGYQDDAATKIGDHKAAGPLRGGKYSKFEGGTRVPMITYWPGRIKPGTSTAMISQVDFPATFGAIAGVQDAFQENEIPDSKDLSSSLLGDSPEGRKAIVQHAGGLSIRCGHWKYISPSRGRKKNSHTNTELGNNLLPQLYHLGDDIGETQNLHLEFPAKSEELRKLLATIRAASPNRQPKSEAK